MTENGQARNGAADDGMAVKDASASQSAGFVPGTEITVVEMRAATAPGATQAMRDAIIDKLPTTSVDDHGIPRTLYIWEGDMLLSREQVSSLLRPENAQPRAKVGSAAIELKQMVDAANRPVLWARGQRALTYVVDVGSFPAGTAPEITAAMREAARKWEDACGNCGVTIRETTGGSPTFRVRYVGSNLPYAAAAFFPSDPAWMRTLTIAPSFFGMKESKAGVLRHELGHTLGYVHEQSGGVPGCKYENGRWVAITPYDSRSVMHYLCGGGGTLPMELSPEDIRGHRLVYGA